MAEAEPIPSLSELNWFGDLTFYQHPPCTFILWYLALGGVKVYELICELLGGEGGGDDKKEDKDKEEGGEEGEAPAEGEEPPAEEEEAAE